MLTILIVCADLALGMGSGGDGGMVTAQYVHPRGPVVALSAASADERFALLTTAWRWSARDTRLPPYFQMGIALTNVETDRLPSKYNFAFAVGATAGPWEFQFGHISPGRQVEGATQKSDGGFNYVQALLHFR